MVDRPAHCNHSLWGDVGHLSKDLNDSSHGHSFDYPTSGIDLIPQLAQVLAGPNTAPGYSDLSKDVPSTQAGPIRVLPWYFASKESLRRGILSSSLVMGLHDGRNT